MKKSEHSRLKEKTNQGAVVLHASGVATVAVLFLLFAPPFIFLLAEVLGLGLWLSFLLMRRLLTR